MELREVIWVKILFPKRVEVEKYIDQLVTCDGDWRVNITRVFISFFCGSNIN